MGRKQNSISPVKQTAVRLGLPLLQFEDLKSKEAVEKLRTLNADLAVVVSFGQIISQEILDLYPLGVLNVHPSLLPKYRGASPMAGAILAGETETGVSIMKMDALMDHGPVYTQIRADIHPDDTTITLSDRLAKQGGNLLLQTIHQLVKNPALPSSEQDHTQATIVHRFTKEDGLLDWHKPALSLERAIRAYQPWPGAYTIIEGKRLKVLAGALGPKPEHTAGTQLISPEQDPMMACGKRLSHFNRVQPEGGNANGWKDFYEDDQGGAPPPLHPSPPSFARREGKSERPIQKNYFSPAHDPSTHTPLLAVFASS